MRARYSAHTTADIDYIVATHHPDTRSEIDVEQTKSWASDSQWLGISILNVEGGQVGDQSAEVEFMASYIDPNGQKQSHHELSEFERYENEWFFKDARTPQVVQFRRDQPKVGRNDPCSCGSRKKYKKCCGKAA
jgi:SEC-C motif-containing protein